MGALPWPSLLLVGPTGSGKTPLGQEMERRGLAGRRCVHFDFGANLRLLAAATEPEPGLTAADLRVIRDSLATGALFEERDLPMIIKILRLFAEKGSLTPDALLVLNGLPRHRRQAEDLAGVVAVERVIQFEASAAVIRERIWLDPGGDRARRVDDTLEAVEKRLGIFWGRTLPLFDFYRERRVPILVIPVTAGMTAGQMYESLIERLSNNP